MKNALTSLVLCLFASTALASEEIDYFSLSAEELFNTTISSVSKKNEKLWDAPAAISVITSEDILRSGATSIPEALRMVPGVQVARTGTNGWAVSIRGFINSGLGNKLLVLMDGREVYDPLFSGVYWDIQDTVLEDIERIEVIRGPGAALWGSNAVNGVINIITKKAGDTQGNLISAIAGNQERAILSGRHGGKMGENGHYRIFAKTTDRDAQRALTGGDSIDDMNAQRSGFRTDWENGADSYNMQGEFYNSESDQFRNVPLLAAPFSQVEEENIEAKGGNLLGTWSRSYSDNEKLTLKTYVNYSTRNQRTLEDERLTFDADLQYEFPVREKQALVVGGKYRRTSDELTPTSILTFSNPERTDDTFSGFIQDKITLMPEKWYLTLGSKFEHNDYTGFEIQPNARLQWHPKKDRMAWASIARAVRTPSRLEHDLDILLGVFPPQPVLPVPLTTELLASPEFGSEELIAHEIGYRQELTPELMLDVAGFYNDYDQLATTHVDTLSFTRRPGLIAILLDTTNENSGKTYGGESMLSWRARDDLNFSASYSYLLMDLSGPPSAVAVDVEAPEHESPRHQFNIMSQWDMNDYLSLDTSFYYVGRLSGRQPVNDYTRLDMRLGWKINDQLQFNLVGQNLLDDAHREFLSPTDANAVEIRRSVYGNLVWRF